MRVVLLLPSSGSRRLLTAPLSECASALLIERRLGGLAVAVTYGVSLTVLPLIADGKRDTAPTPGHTHTTYLL